MRKKSGEFFFTLFFTDEARLAFNVIHCHKKTKSQWLIAPGYRKRYPAICASLRGLEQAVAISHFTFNNNKEDSHSRFTPSE
jgi:hypothetical protein